MAPVRVHRQTTPELSDQVHARVETPQHASMTNSRISSSPFQVGKIYSTIEGYCSALADNWKSLEIGQNKTMSSRFGSKIYPCLFKGAD